MSTTNNPPEDMEGSAMTPTESLISAAKLLPCPFCGSPAARGRCVSPDMVRCTNEKTPHCPASFGCVSVEAWNTRTALTAAEADEGKADEKLLPLSNERMRCLIRNAIYLMNRRELNVPLWSIVGSLTSHGSGYSSQICRELGLDPNQIIRTPNQQILSLPEPPSTAMRKDKL